MSLLTTLALPFILTAFSLHTTLAKPPSRPSAAEQSNRWAATVHSKYTSATTVRDSAADQLGFHAVDPWTHTHETPAHEAAHAKRRETLEGYHAAGIQKVRRARKQMRPTPYTPAAHGEETGNVTVHRRSPKYSQNNPHLKSLRNARLRRNRALVGKNKEGAEAVSTPVEKYNNHMLSSAQLSLEGVKERAKEWDVQDKADPGGTKTGIAAEGLSRTERITPIRLFG